MYDALLQIIAPHYCYGCNKTGRLLCENCKYSIVNDRFEQCLLCLKPSIKGVCETCRSKVAFSTAWCIGEREEILKRLINDYKFMRVKAAYRVFAQLLHQSVAVLPSETIVVPVPTASSHIRQRGYDHCLLIAKEFARLRQLEFQPHLLQRQHNDSQRGKSKKRRLEQASKAFLIHGQLRDNVPYLVIDDIMTTSATVNAAARLLKRSGAEEVFVAVVARQTLDE